MASDSTMKILGGGNPGSSMTSMPKERMDPPLRSQTVDAHDCNMVPIQDEIDRIQSCDANGVTR